MTAPTAADRFAAALGAGRGRPETPAAVVAAFLNGESAECATLRSVRVADHVHPARFMDRCYLLDERGELLARLVLGSHGASYAPLAARENARGLLWASGRDLTGASWTSADLVTQLAHAGVERPGLQRALALSERALLKLVLPHVTAPMHAALVRAGRDGWLTPNSVKHAAGVARGSERQLLTSMQRMGQLNEVTPGSRTWMTTRDGQLVRELLAA